MLYFGQQNRYLKRLYNRRPLIKTLMKLVYKNFKIVLLLFTVLSLTFFAQSCKEENPSTPSGTGDNSVKVVFTGTTASGDFSLGKGYDLANEGFRYKFSLLKFYISKFSLIKSDGSELMLNDIALIDFRVDQPNTSFSVKVPEGEYTGFKFGIGVDSINNSKLPASFAAEHPLSSAQGTYWEMTSKYRFMLIEGQLDTLRGATEDFSEQFVVHTGTDELYREKTYTKSLSFTKGDNRTLNLVINMDNLLSNADFRKDHVSHTLGSGFPLAEKIADNFAANITLK